MNTKILNTFLLIASIGLTLIFCLKFMSKDQAPVITFDDSCVIEFKEGDREETLIKGLRATDEEDGDITDDVFVVSVIDAKDNEHAIVTYGVKDSAKNTVTAKRKVNFKGTGGTAISIEVYNAEELAARQALGLVTLVNDLEGEDASSDSNDRDPKIPVMTLSERKLIAKVGDSFNPLALISSYSDDVDDSDYLSKHVNYDGTYDMNTAGTYVLNIYCTDSNGNDSVKQEITLIVTDK